MRPLIFAIGLTLLAGGPLAAAEMTPDAINAATFTGKIPSEDRPTALAVKVQVLLDRAHFSPGEIDGHFGDNVEKALQAYAEAKTNRHQDREKRQIGHAGDGQGRADQSGECDRQGCQGIAGRHRQLEGEQRVEQAV